MRKITLSVVCVLIMSMLVFAACDGKGESMSISSIKIDDNSVYFVYEIDEFNLSDIKLQVTDNQGTVQLIPLSSDFISDESTALLKTTGQHIITVEYGGKTTQLNLNMVTEKSLFHTTYELALSAGAADTDYQTWLNTIKGDKGEKIQLNVGQIHLQYRYEGETQWIDLLDLSALKGKPGNDGVNGKEIELGIDNGFISWRMQGNLQWNPLFSLSQMQGANGNDGKDGTDGKDGLTPYINENGNWWIGEEDTGVAVLPQERTDTGTDGLYFAMTIIDGQAGYEVISYNMDTIDIVRDIVIPEYLFGVKVISIGNEVFKDNSYLESISIPKSITRIKQSAFYNCNNLKTVTFAQNSELKTIENRAFYKNSSLVNIDIPESLRYIDYEVFYNAPLCNNLILPETLQYVGNAAFSGNQNYNAIYIKVQDTSNWASNWTDKDALQIHMGVKVQDEYIYNYNADGTIRFVGYTGSDKKLIMPSKIENKAVTSVGSYALVGNSTLEGIIFPRSLNTIETYAFIVDRNIAYLLSLSLSYIHIPNTVQVVEQHAFIVDYNYNLKIYLEASELPQGWAERWAVNNSGGAYMHVFSNIGESDLIIEENLHFVIDGSNASVTGTTCRDFEDLNIPSSVQGKTVNRIASFAFKKSLKSLIMPSSITDIDSYAFYGVEIIETLEMGDGIQRIASYAFYDSAAFVFIPKTVALIGEHAFSSGCTLFTPYIERPLGWDSNFANSSTIYWNTKKVLSEKGFTAILKTNDKAAIIAYDEAYNLGTIFIPEKIQGYTVNEIRANAIQISTGNVKVVIPDTIQIIERFGVYLSGGNSRIFVETYNSSTKPSDWNSNWYYTYSSYLYWTNQWQYVEGEPIPN